MRIPCKKRGQNIIEYVVIVSVVSMALVAMNIYVQRATQANLKMIEQKISTKKMGDIFHSFESTGYTAVE